MNYPHWIVLFCFSAVPFLHGDPPPAKVLNAGLLPIVDTPDPVTVQFRALVAQSTTDDATIPDRASRLSNPQKAGKFLQTADNAKIFRDTYPNRPESLEAKTLE